MWYSRYFLFLSLLQHLERARRSGAANNYYIKVRRIDSLSQTKEALETSCERTYPHANVPDSLQALIVRPPDRWLHLFNNYKGDTNIYRNGIRYTHNTVDKHRHLGPSLHILHAAADPPLRGTTAGTLRVSYGTWAKRSIPIPSPIGTTMLEGYQDLDAWCAISAGSQSRRTPHRFIVRERNRTGDRSVQSGGRCRL